MAKRLSAVGIEADGAEADPIPFLPGEDRGGIKFKRYFQTVFLQMFGGRAKLFQLLAVVFVINEVHFQKVQNGKPLQKVFSQLVL